ncbi:hypothetical protein [Aestuariivirga sp.]|uniref:hypothetical protein n=1 Tax=Aestuariivirga sp. TaxID=2650926 RepID=UPI0039E5F782
MEAIKAKPSSKKILPDQTQEPLRNDDAPDGETILFFAGQIRQKQALVKLAQKALSRTRKQALNSGLVMKELLEVMADADMEPEAVAAKYARRKAYSEALAVPIGKQFSLFDAPPRGGIPTFKERGEKAYQDGLARGIMGENPDDQAYGAGHEHHTSHNEGWRAGQDKLLEKIGWLDAQEAAAEQAKADKAKAKTKQRDDGDDDSGDGRNAGHGDADGEMPPVRH